jgi:hypothetical protein
MAGRGKPALTRVQRLERDRDALEAAIEDASKSTLPNLVREHRQVLKELAALAEPEKGSTRDQLAAKRKEREARTAGTAGSSSS